MKNRSKNTFSIKKKYLSVSEIEAQKEAEKQPGQNRSYKPKYHDTHRDDARDERPARPDSDVRAKKHLGQHFLTDEHIAKQIADALLDADNKTAAIEIGPGTGVLTKYLLPELKHFFALDVDRESIPYLQKTFTAHAKQFLLADFLETDLRQICPGKFNVIGNFPYNISSQIMFRVLDHKDDVDIVVGMFQKEVAERMAEKPGTKVYGILSVLLQTFYDIEYLFTVHEDVFNPPPKVKSAVVRFRRNSRRELPCSEALFTNIVKTTFNQRRKTIRNSIRPILGDRKVEHPYMDERPEQLSVEQFIELTTMISRVIQPGEAGSL